jgi:gluconate:H+ symporter, GntP family
MYSIRYGKIIVKMIDPFWLLLVGIVIVVGGILVLRLQAFLALMLGALAVGLLTSSDMLLYYAQQSGMNEAAATVLARQTVGERVAVAFGNTCAKIGILIAMASIIGGCLLKSGAAERIVRSALRLFGEKNAPLGFLSSSFTLAIPVFFDTVFYLMIPLGKAMAMRTRRNYALYVMAIVAGGVMAHSLVPPTPGPLFVAGALGVSIGLMMIGGMIFGIITIIFGYLYAVWADRKWPIPLRDTQETTLEELSTVTQQDDSQLPPLWLSILPILLPVLLIAGNTALQSTIGKQPATELSGLESRMLSFFMAVGNSNFALTLAALIAILMLFLKIRERLLLKKTIVDALSSAGMIILITGAGGAFGSALQQTGIGFRIESLASDYQIAVLPLAFVVTALVRTAQGSATVAMITSIGILGGLATSGSLGFHPLYLALAIGCGSKLFAWMNDSGFWIICKMSGMTEAETIKHFSFQLAIMGIAGLIAIMIAARLIPLV